MLLSVVEIKRGKIIFLDKLKLRKFFFILYWSSFNDNCTNFFTYVYKHQKDVFCFSVLYRIKSI